MGEIGRRASLIGDVAHGRDGLVSEILDALPVALFCKDAGDAFRFICWNRTAETWWGLPRERILGRNDYDFFPREHADFFRAKDEETMRSGERVEIPEEPLDTPMGLRLLHTLKVPIAGEPPHPGFLLGISWDITETRASARELERQRAMQVAQARLASLGVMASGIAHEINNPLSVIGGWASQLRRLAESDKLEPAFVQRASCRIEETVTRISAIVRAMRSLARKTEGDAMRRFPLSALLEDTLSLCRARFAEGAVDLRVEADASLYLVGRHAELGQVLLNLLNNAFDAVVGLPNARVELAISLEGEHVRIAVTDTGPGVPDTLREQIMEPFFTTKEPGAGTGLGLSISRAIVENHKGELHLEPVPRGARFVVRLPAALPTETSP